jgi:polyribonucleotide nucleotidyltransferase
VRITDFGAFVEIAPKTDGMVHVSQLADHPVQSVYDEISMGQEISVMVTAIDDGGKIRLSRKAVLEGMTLEEAIESDSRGGPRRSSGGGDRGPRRDGGGGGRSGGGGGDRGPRREFRRD